MKLNNKGLSVMEVIVALAVIVIGMLGVMSLLVQSVQVSAINRNRLLASMLAQEGFELVRNIRDSNWMNGDDWDDGLDNADKTFVFDYEMTAVNRTPNAVGDAGARLKKNTDGFYEHTEGTDTMFYRLLKFDKHASGDYATVDCEIKWTGGYYKASTLLYDWK